jgi:cell division protein ZapA
MELASKNRVCVRIAGNEYTLCGNESSEHIQRVALFVDKKMSEIKQANHTLSTSMASVLTAVNAVDELLKNSEAKEVLEKELEITQKSLKEAKQEIEQLSQQLQKLNEENRHLVLELTRREAELTEVRKSLDRAVGDSTHKQPRIHNIK